MTALRDTALETLWARVPDAGCKGLCRASCGPIIASEAERRRIIERHGIALGRCETKPGSPWECPALDADGQCRVYVDRPLICRLFGSVEGLPCEHGCSPALGRLPDKTGHELLTAVINVDPAPEGEP